MTTQSFFYWNKGTLTKINLDEIYYLEANDNYVEFKALTYKHMVRTSLDAALSQLPKNQFVRIHRSGAVAINYIESIEKSSLKLISVPDEEISIGRTYYAGLIERISIIGVKVGE